MDRVVVAGSDYVEARQLEPDREPTSPTEEVDGYWTTRRLGRLRHDAHPSRQLRRKRSDELASDPVTDTRTPEQRKRIMSAVKRRNTGPELTLRRALWAAGVRGWRCDYARAPGRPDLAWPGRKVAVFVDGAFWHGHPSRHKSGRSGKYWDEKIAANIARDRRVDGELEAAGWRVARFWDFEVRKSLPATVEKVREILQTDQI